MNAGARAASVNEAGALSVWSRPASVDTLSLGVSPEEVVMMGRGSTFSSEFREQAVELVRATGKTIAEDARDLQINGHDIGQLGHGRPCRAGRAGQQRAAAADAEERAELTRLAGSCPLGRGPLAVAGAPVAAALAVPAARRSPPAGSPEGWSDTVGDSVE